MLIVDILLWIILAVTVLVSTAACIYSFTSLDNATYFLGSAPTLVIALLIIKLVMLS